MSSFNPFALGASCFTGIFKTMERLVNSSEHNFKSDLDDLLKDKIPDDLRKKIKNILNKGTDEEIGQKIRALLASGLIPPELEDQVMSLAEQNGMPRSSFDADAVREEMSGEEIRSVLGGDFSDELDAAEADQEAENAEKNEEEGEEADSFPEFKDRRYANADTDA